MPNHPPQSAPYGSAPSARQASIPEGGNSQDPWTPPPTPSQALPDRGHLLTEQRLPASGAIDAMGTEAVLGMINTQDTQVPMIIRNAIPAIARLVDDVIAMIRIGGRLIYCGAGTSGRLGVLDASEIPPTFCTDPSLFVGLIAGGDSALRTSSEGTEDEMDDARQTLESLKLSSSDTVIGIAAGGSTPWVWGALDYAQQQGCTTALLCCVRIKSLVKRKRAPLVAANQAVPVAPPKAQLPVAVKHVIELPVGPEVITGSTRMKAGTATKLVLNMISTTVMVRLGKTWGNLMVDLSVKNDKLQDRALRILIHQCDLTREQALRLLDHTGGQVKPALVMAKRRVTLKKAYRLLEKHGGMLRPMLGDPK